MNFLLLKSQQRKFSFHSCNLWVYCQQQVTPGGVKRVSMMKFVDDRSKEKIKVYILNTQHLVFPSTVEVNYWTSDSRNRLRQVNVEGVAFLGSLHYHILLFLIPYLHSTPPFNIYNSFRMSWAGHWAKVTQRHLIGTLLEKWSWPVGWTCPMKWEW